MMARTNISLRLFDGAIPARRPCVWHWCLATGTTAGVVDRGRRENIFSEKMFSRKLYFPPPGDSGKSNDPAIYKAEA